MMLTKESGCKHCGKQIARNADGVWVTIIIQDAECVWNFADLVHVPAYGNWS